MHREMNAEVALKRHKGLKRNGGLAPRPTGSGNPACCRHQPTTASAAGKSFMRASRKIHWRWGVLAALAMALLSCYPQIDLWLTRGAEWQGAYASMFYDEEVYAAYLNGLVRGQPRSVQPLQVDLTKPPSESLFSIQVVPAYLLVFLARVTEATVPQIFMALTPLAAFLATLMIFYLLALTTGDERLAAAGALAVLLLGTPVSRDSVLLKWLLGKRVGSGSLLFLRRYQPAIVFPIFFGYMALVWHAFTAQGHKAKQAAIAAGAAFAVIIFSYFFLWTAALAWLACLVLVWLMARRTEWLMVVKRLSAMMLLAVPAFAVYAMMLAHRDHAMDKLQILVFTHAPDFHRTPEWIAVMVILLLIWSARKGRVDWHQPTVLLAGSLALLPLAIFNQQIISGRSLQPIHYEEFIANYLSLLALVLTLTLLRQGRDYFFMRQAPRLAVALLAGIALCWGGIEVNYMVRQHRYRNVERDRFVPVAKRLTALAVEHRSSSHHREVVFSPDIHAISDNITTFAPQAPFWGTHVPYAAGLSWEGQQERFFQYLYYCGLKADALESLLTHNDAAAIISLFGVSRYWPELTIDFKPITDSEIQDKVRQYNQYAATFNCERARQTEISYAVVYTKSSFDFTNLDQWYVRDKGEQIGPFTLYQVKLRQIFGNVDREVTDFASSTSASIYLGGAQALTVAPL